MISVVSYIRNCLTGIVVGLPTFFHRLLEFSYQYLVIFKCVLERKSKKCTVVNRRAMTTTRKLRHVSNLTRIAVLY